MIIMVLINTIACRRQGVVEERLRGVEVLRRKRSCEREKKL